MPKRVARAGFRSARSVSGGGAAFRHSLAGTQCAGCGLAAHRFDQLPQRPYAYLLGIYLGDGTIGPVDTSWSLRVTLDEAYPGIVEECAQAIHAVRGSRPCFNRGNSDQHYVVLTSGWKAWRCLFPQHGPGTKHTRRIWLAGWQQQIVDAEPGAFLRGLIHSDGWRGVNRVHAKGHEYAYPRYQFSNRSDDIRRMFTDACARLGIEWRPWTRYHVSVARRDSVAILDHFVGPKE